MSALSLRWLEVLIVSAYFALVRSVSCSVTANVMSAWKESQLSRNCSSSAFGVAVPMYTKFQVNWIAHGKHELVLA